jgi:hypothetical protein
MVYGCDRTKFADRNAKTRGGMRDCVEIEIYGGCRFVQVFLQLVTKASCFACAFDNVSKIRRST